MILTSYKMEHHQSRFIRLRGLDPNKQYHNDFTNTTHSGRFYMERGLDMSGIIMGTTGCRLVIITEANA